MRRGFRSALVCILALGAAPAAHAQTASEWSAAEIAILRTLIPDR
jgi:hypothetical protein